MTQLTVAAAPGRQLSRHTGFWVSGGVLWLFFLASAVPSPLYGLYQAQWHFSALTLTAVFAVYALALLTALLVTGSLSDAIGRRPVLLGSLLIELVGIAVFAGADSVGWLYAARILQGAGTGIAAAALSAGLIDLRPHSRPWLPAVVISAAPTSGQAAGALLAGALAEYGPAPTRLVYWILIGAFLIAAFAVWTMPESVTSRSFSRAVLLPHIGVPRQARRPFLATVPCVVAIWSLSGLHLSLGPLIATEVTRSTNHLTGALVVALLTGFGAITATALHGRSPRWAMLVGSGLLVIGMVVTLAALATGSLGTFLLGTAVAGCGFGLGLLGTFGALSAMAPPAHRGRLAAAMFTVCYLAFSLPAMAAGVAIARIGLTRIALGYGAAVGALAVLALLVTAFPRRAAPATELDTERPTASPTHPSESARLR